MSWHWIAGLVPTCNLTWQDSTLSKEFFLEPLVRPLSFIPFKGLKTFFHGFEYGCSQDGQGQGKGGHDKNPLTHGNLHPLFLRHEDRVDRLGLNEYHYRR